jgi:hypothetical protein
MRQPLRFLLLLLAWTALGRSVAWAAPIAGTKTVLTGIQPAPKTYAIQPFTATVDILTSVDSYRFETIPAAAVGVIGYPQTANGTTTYVAATAGLTITPQQAANLIFQAAAGATPGTATFTYTVLQNNGLGTTRSNPASYTITLAVGDALTSPIIENTAVRMAIPTLSAGAASPTNYRIVTLPSSGTLYVGTAAATAGLVITAAQAAQLAFSPAAGYFGTTSFTYLPLDAAGYAGDAGTYALPVTKAVCTQNNTTLDFSRRTAGEDWKNHASLAVNGANISTTGFTSAVTGTNTNTFAIGNNGALPGPSLVWQQNPMGLTPPNTSTVTFTFDRPVTNLSLSVQDIDKDITGANFTDELTFDGYTSATSTTPIVLTAGNFALATNVNQFVAGTNTVQGTGVSNADAAGNIVVTFTVPVQRLTLTFKNTAPFVNSTTNRTHTAGITSMTWCRLPPMANNVTSSTVPNTAGQVGISPLSSTVDGTVTTYTIATIPNATTQGTLYYNSTGTTYAAIAAGQTLTEAQANSLRFDPVDAATGNVTFTYTVQDDNGQSSNTATYTIPVLVLTPCATATTTLDFATFAATPVDNWKTHAAISVPAGSSSTTISSGNYTTGPTSTSTLQIGAVNNTNSLAWTNQYTSTTPGTGTTPGTDRTSSVTFTFNRAVSNFTVQVQDIDVNDATGSTFIDQVVFNGSNNGTAVTPTLTALNPNGGSVTINGNTATGRSYNTANGVDGTVTAYFSSPITSLTLTYNNTTTGTNISTAQGIGIDKMTWCRLAPTALNVTTATVPSTVTQVGIASLNGTADGTVQSYLITSLPLNGTLLYNSTGTTYAAVAANQTLTLAQAASLRYTPNAAFTGTSTTFGFKAIDDAGITSTNTATYTIPLSNAACTTATATLNFGTSTPVPEDWRTHAAVAIPAGSTQTSLSSGNYQTPSTVTTSTLSVTAANGTNGINNVQTLVWYTDYANQTDNTSSVTFNFTRPVSNFALRVQDIDRVEDANNAFADQVTFVGANGTTTVLPVLGPATANNANSVIINGNVATGTANNTSTTDATVIAYFASPVTSITLTYRNLSTNLANPTGNAIGIDLLSFCRLAPVASNITNNSRPGGQATMAVNSLSATADGTIASYTIAAVPPASQGTFYVNGVVLSAANFPGLVLTPTQATQLSFAPATGFSGNASFSYTATDDAGVVSNTATYAVPVTNTGAAGTPAPCATPGKDGSLALGVNPNTYYPATQSAAAGTTSLVVGAATLGDNSANPATPTTITKGDLLLVIQMQGADIDYSNTNAYGDGVAGGGASGNLTTNFTAGTYEYVVANNTTTITAAGGGTIQLASALVNSYANANATTTTGQQRFQVIRVPQYINLTINGTIAATPWNGTTGGILAIDVAGQTTFSTGGTLDASARGFRGGGGRTQTAVNNDSPDYVNATDLNAQKGEGTAGTPRYVNAPTTPTNATTNVVTTLTADGYPGGTSGRGAPGNAGGGGNDDIDNSGGGGGANGGTGGRGGNNFSTNLAIGGEPGTSFDVVSSSRLVLGGGGGAGTTNNSSGTPGSGAASSGAPGGGLIILRTGSVTGTGTIVANGGNANGSVVDDGSGGGGAGGTILVTASNTVGLANLTLRANGGTGGTNTGGTSGNHGPGGGGGGGVILTNGAVAAASAAGAGSGTTKDGTAFGAAAGFAGVSNTQISNSIANSATGATCAVDVATTITGPATVNAGQPTGSFTATFANLGAGTASAVTQRVTLPTGAGLTAAQRAAIVAAYPNNGVTFTTTGTGTTTITTINFGTLPTLVSGASNSYSFAYTAPTTIGTATTTSNTSTTSSELGLTANNTATFNTTVAAAADVTVALNGPTTLNAGQPTGNFTATFTNEGPSTANNVDRIVTLPTGAMVTAAQQATIKAAYATASFTTTGTGTSAVTTINFGQLASLASDANSVVMFAFTAPTSTGSSSLTGSTSTTSAEGTNSAPNQSTLTLNTVGTADARAIIAASATATQGTFNVTFSNIGAQDAAGVVRSVQLPAGLTGPSTASTNADGSSNNGVTVTNGYYNATTGLVVYSPSPTTIAPGSSLTSSITYNLASNTTPVAATATVSTTTNEAGLTANNAATAVMPAQFDLATTLTGAATTIAGSPTMLYVTTSNNGPNSAPLASQTISIPSDLPLTNVYITNGGTYVYNATMKIGTVTFPSVPNLPSGQTVANSISFSAPASSFAPSAVVAPTTGDSNTANNTAYLNGNTTSTSVTVSNATAAKSNEGTTITADAAIVSAGSVVTYTVKSFNNGFLNTTSVADVAEQVQLLPGLTSSLTNPASSTLTVGGVNGTQTGNTITFITAAGTTTYNTATGVLTYPVLASQASGSSFTYDKLAVTVPANVGNNGQLLATASVSTADSDPVPADNTSSVVVKVLTPADLVSRITGPTTTTAGQTASYTATFTNLGTGSATSVVETAQLPAGLTNVLVQDASGNVITNAYSSTTGLVTFPALANDPMGSSQVYSLSFTAPAQSFSVSSYTSSGTTDNTTTNNASLLRTTVSPTADVAVYVSGPATAVAGNAVTYAVTTANNGPDAASAVQATLQLPAGLTGAGTVVTNTDGSSNNGVVLTGGGTYNATTGLVTFLSVSLAAGDSRVGLVTFTMPNTPANGQVSGTASVSTSSTDIVASNNTSAITTDVAPATSDVADLVTSIVPPASPAIAGTTISYELRFRNNSTTTPAIKVMPTAYLPAGLMNVVVRDINNAIVPNAYNSTTGQVVLPTIDSQTANTVTSYTVSLTAPANAVVISASAVSSNTSDPNPANNIIGNTLNITASYDVVTTLAGPASAMPGSVNTYTVTTTNNGPSTSSATANSTTQTVTVPANSIVSGVPANAYNPATGVITFPAISGQAAGANGAVTNTFTVTMPATGSLALTAKVTATGESNVDNDSFTLATTPTNQAPVAQNVWNTLKSARGNTANQQAPTGLLISPLNATDADGTISKYSLVSLPDPTQGVLYLSNGSPAALGDVPANGLYFAPTPGYVGNATFTYRAIDNGSAVSNTALYTIPVAQDLASTYATYNSGKSTYTSGEVLAQAVDPNAATYNSSGAIYSTTGVLQSGASNGLSNAVLTSGTLPTGVSLDPATGRIYVSDASLLPKLMQTTSYSLQVTTTDANGGTSLAPVTFTLGATPLPVSLTEFTAQAVANRDALLSWHTASEQHNDHFEVERSFDGTSFTKLGQVAGHGTTSAASAYTFTDAGVAAQATGPVYYRLRQVDLDGTATYSPQRTVSFTKVVLAKLALFPNPVQNRTNLDLSVLAATTSVQAQLLDATGRQIRTWTLAGGVAQPLELTDLASGSYLLVVTGQQPDGSLLKQTLRLTKE